ncbi:YdcF family protein [Paenibacillus mucilaginosus]|uniref:DUF218 domain-containing protein n=1 Tax=Paenibacillus mucilaginosus (strain KNP414) TaxID=1036673 RepID=F8F9N3_PAEMK|nr:YdcF family protein [Paenibacillus mucilaginosus]AEI44362.1 protein of unknown function DUF218 [Paenibacillus mucilaginosus KNP414]MCG7213743.1 YdcF family protein [Paenibacillus mucilaginosus]WDM25757.1 YdcF family protein [Paenibacillus mucilaginosus]
MTGAKAAEMASRRIRRRWVVRILFPVMILAAGWVGAQAWMIWTYDPGHKTAPSDAAIVLGAAVWGSEPSPVLRERIHHAVDLYRQRLVRKIIFTGGKGKGAGMAESEAAERYAVAIGVPKSDLLTESKSVITEENLRFALELGKTRGLRSYTIVSDPLHLKRSMRMAADLGMEADASAASTTVYRSWRTKVPFWLREVFFHVGYVITKPFRGP